MSRLVRYQLVAVALVAVLGILYVGGRYIRFDQMLGFGRYEVYVRAEQTGGAYGGSEVTYRGVPVGRVNSLDITDDGVLIELTIDTSSPPIPASAAAVVANRSAIGEQYVDLQPSSDEGPFLRDGSIIETATTPVPVEDLLGSVDTLASTTDLPALHSTITELGTALNGKGGELHGLIDSLHRFTDRFHESLPETIQLIRDGRVALGTQAEQAGEIRRFSTGLEQLTAQLRDSDPDLRRLIDTGTDAGGQLGALVDESGPALTADLTNLRSLLRTVSPEFYALQPLLQMLPELSLGASATAPGDGTSHFGLVLETNNPPACTVGYEGTQRILDEMEARDPDFDDTVDEFPFNTEAKCAVPFGNPTAVRGGARADSADPAIVQPWDDNPKTDPDKLDLNPIAVQVATVLGVTPKR